MEGQFVATRSMWNLVGVCVGFRFALRKTASYVSIPPNQNGTTAKGEYYSHSRVARLNTDATSEFPS